MTMRDRAVAAWRQVDEDIAREIDARFDLCQTHLPEFGGGRR